MKILSTILLCLLFLANCNAQPADFLQQLSKQVTAKADLLNGRYSDYTVNGSWAELKDKPGWLIGFLGGELWLMYDLTGDEQLKVRALKHANKMLQYATLDNTHDLGFIFLPSVVQAFKHTGDKKYRDAAILAARTLAKRFNAKGNFIQAWGVAGSGEKAGWTIIDTMMNLELLFWAAQETGDYSLYDIAYKHALTCLKNTVRDNYSSYHVVEYDPETGSVVRKRTHQGYSDESTWARGQAWGIYGFAKAYSYTKDQRFLTASKKMADYFITKLPEDFVPYWDLDLSGEKVVRDASAGAIAGAGMRLLSSLVTQADDYTRYYSVYKKTAKSLIANYSFLSSKRTPEQGLLLHTVYNFAKGWGIDESFPCGDYYFMETVRNYYQDVNEENSIKFTGKRESFTINNNWFYLEDNIANFTDINKSAKTWEKVDLPHTWNKTDVFDPVPGYRRAASWYKKEIFIPKSDIPAIYKLHFDAVNIKSEVYVNGVRAGGHVGGYIGFDIDITDLIKHGDVNTIFVKADNSIDINVIPSQKGDFFIYGGIPRSVSLNVLPLVSIDAVHVSTPVVSNEAAETNVAIQITNKKNVEKKYTIEALLLSSDGKEVQNQSSKKEIAPGTSTLTIAFRKLKNPRLWSPSSPTLYTVKVLLKENGETIDEISDRIGYRFYEFKDHGAFYLNGERLFLRGTHRHEELIGYGNAIPDSLHRKDMQMIKDLGANFVRLAHYPQAPEVYRACDELGLLVWDEVPWCRAGMGGAEWQANTKRLLTEQIDQHFNHPSIILWSIGNESDWLPDFPDGDNPDSLKWFAGEMHNLAKSLDPGRLTVARKFEAAASSVDVFSPSMWPGWYSTVYKEYENVLKANNKKYKHMFHAEYGGDSHVGRHTETPATGEGSIPADDGQEKAIQVKLKTIANDGDWSESYIVNLFDWYLRYQETSDWLSGAAQWIFRDFGTPLRPENPIPYVNQKGLVDRNNNPKDAYYVFKSYWTINPKFCYIESKTWTFRSGPRNVKREVKVFSNCQEVELFLNGISLGKIKKDIQKFPASGLNWKVDFAEGKNTLTANGIQNGELVTVDSLTVEYTYKKIEKPEEILLSHSRLSNGNYLVTAKVVDKNGRLCTDFNRKMYFDVNGSGIMITDCGTPINSSVIDAANGQASIEVKTVPSEETILEVRTQDFKGHYYHLPK